MAPNPYTKQYLMTAGPTPVPPAVSQVRAADWLHIAGRRPGVSVRSAGRMPARSRTLS